MTFVEKMAQAFEDELKKIASEKKAAPVKSTLLVPGMVAGALGMYGLQRAHHDWRMGRAMRLQNQGY